MYLETALRIPILAISGITLILAIGQRLYAKHLNNLGIYKGHNVGSAKQNLPLFVTFNPLIILSSLGSVVASSMSVFFHDADRPDMVSGAVLIIYHFALGISSAASMSNLFAFQFFTIRAFAGVAADLDSKSDPSRSRGSSATQNDESHYQVAIHEEDAILAKHAADPRRRGLPEWHRIFHVALSVSCFAFTIIGTTIEWHTNNANFSSIFLFMLAVASTLCLFVLIYFSWRVMQRISLAEIEFEKFKDQQRATRLSSHVLLPNPLSLPPSSLSSPGVVLDYSVSPASSVLSDAGSTVYSSTSVLKSDSLNDLGCGWPICLSCCSGKRDRMLRFKVTVIGSVLLLLGCSVEQFRSAINNATRSPTTFNPSSTSDVRDVLVMLLMAGNCFAVYLVWLSAPASSVRDATESVSSDPSLDDPDAPYLAFLESVDGVMAVPTSPTVTYTPGGSGIVLDHSAPASIKLQSTAT